jgi:hypothetical protein
MAACAAGAVTAGEILLWISQHFPSIDLQQVLDIMPQRTRNRSPEAPQEPNTPYSRRTATATSDSTDGTRTQGKTAG